MSGIESVAWVKKLRLTPERDPRDERRVVSRTFAKFVLMVLADYADERYSCFPSVARIAEDAEMSVRSVQDQLAWLVELGLAKRERRDFGFQKRGHNRYVLSVGMSQEELEARRLLVASGNRSRNGPSARSASHRREKRLLAPLSTLLPGTRKRAIRHWMHRMHLVARTARFRAVAHWMHPMHPVRARLWITRLIGAHYMQMTLHYMQMSVARIRKNNQQEQPVLLLPHVWSRPQQPSTRPPTPRRTRRTRVPGWSAG